jgi:hypothetical protein
MATERRCGLASVNDGVLLWFWGLTDFENRLTPMELADTVYGRARWRNEFRGARCQRGKDDSVSLTWQSQVSLADEGGQKALPVDGSRRIDARPPVPAARLAAVRDALATGLDLATIAQTVD